MNVPVNRAVLRADDALRIALAAVWILEGLLPKILFLRPAEIEAFTRATPFLPLAPEPLILALGGFETALGGLLLLGLAVLPILWIMLTLIVLFTATLLFHSPVLLLDPYGGLIKNLALIGATGALIALRRGALSPLIRQVHRLRWDVLNEIGAEVIYRQQARAARQLGLSEALREFARTEREHASAVTDALQRMGSRGPFTGGLVALFSTVLGWLLGRMGDRIMLRADVLLEHLAVRSYSAGAEQFAAWGEELLASEFRLMTAAEEDHARRLRELMQSLKGPSGID